MHPGLSILVFFGALILGYIVIAPRVGFMAALLFYPGDMESLEADLFGLKTLEYLRTPALVFQGVSSLIGLIVLPMLSLRFIVKERLDVLATRPQVTTLVLVLLTVILFMFPNSIVIDWNANLNFSGELWQLARSFEEKAEKFTKFITVFNSTGDFLFGLLIIAVLPAIGEEFTFRGWLQPAVQKATGNPHVAIWFTAIFFSAFHFQFFGFIPRMLLGAMFGYMMYWSNNLWLPIVAHFFNNGFMVLMIYLYQTEAVQFDVEEAKALPLTYVIPATIIFIAVILFLKKQLESRGKVA
jgi:membrane protease YdiL (CAAX protease family)